MAPYLLIADSTELYDPKPNPNPQISRKITQSGSNPQPAAQTVQLSLLLIQLTGVRH